MLKPNASPFQASSAMADSLEFIKNLWGGMGIPSAMPGMPSGAAAMPGMVLPTLSVDELRKKIAELRAVESWLEINMNMLRTSIQALEVQAATIATLQTMGDTLNATMKAASGAVGAAASAASATASTHEEPRREHAHSLHAAEPSAEDQAEATALTAPLVNAAAWWNQLQSQFQQAVTHAMSTEEKPKANGHDHRAPARPPRKKPVAKAASAPTARKRKTSK